MDLNHSANEEIRGSFEKYNSMKPEFGEPNPRLDECQDASTIPSNNRKRIKTSRQKVLCCFCFKTTKYRRKQFIVGCLTNSIIFSILLAYTFLGSLIFLAIEGGLDVSDRPKLLPDKQIISNIETNQSLKTNKVRDYVYEDSTISANSFLEARSKTVENIWEITVSLNILYRENWTQLAAQEILKFQNELMQRVAMEMASQYGINYKELALGEYSESYVKTNPEEYEWNLALAFFYSLTVLTTIGYGNVAPKTILGKGATIIYAVIGIPLTLLYLWSVGSLLSKMARSIFSKALCCCLCSNCGYCCYDERRMAEKERRKKLKRQQEETYNNTEKNQINENNIIKSATQKEVAEKYVINNVKDDIISWQDTDSKISMHGLSILAPVLLCLAAIFIYITVGTLILFKLDNVGVVDGFYFCFMALSTIGFGSIIPGMSYSTINGIRYYTINTIVLWFCSIYVLIGLALTAMCFGVIHDEIIYRLRHRQKKWSHKNNAVNDEAHISDAFCINS